MNKKLLNYIKELIPYVIVILVVLFVKNYLFTTVIVNGPSMQNTLHNKDLMILNKIGVKINGISRFDIVVVDNGRNKIIKRVIGLPGETIEYKDNKLYINDKEVKDSYGSQPTYDFEKVKLGNNEYFVLGDNRTDSVDSRIIGPVSKDKILGRANFIIYPFKNFGKTK